MDKFINWYRDYYTEITWFVIGILFINFLEDMARENFSGALLNAVLIAVNYMFWKQDNV